MAMFDDHAEEFQGQEIRCNKREDKSWHIFTMPFSTLEHSVYSKELQEGIDIVKASIKQLHRSREDIQVAFNDREDQRVRFKKSEAERWKEFQAKEEAR
jgi:hypothetical protein